MASITNGNTNGRPSGRLNLISEDNTMAENTTDQAVQEHQDNIALAVHDVWRLLEVHGAEYAALALREVADEMKGEATAHAQDYPAERKVMSAGARAWARMADAAAALAKHYKGAGRGAF